MKSIQEVFKDKKIVNCNDFIPFGKYRGYTYSNLVDHDPKYLNWLFYKTDFMKDHTVNEQLLCELESAL